MPAEHSPRRRRDAGTATVGSAAALGPLGADTECGWRNQREHATIRATRDGEKRCPEMPISTQR